MASYFLIADFQPGIIALIVLAALLFIGALIFIFFKTKCKTDKSEAAPAEEVKEKKSAKKPAAKKTTAKKPAKEEVETTEPTADGGEN